MDLKKRFEGWRLQQMSDPVGKIAK